MATLTYSDSVFFPEITLNLSRRPISREAGDICLSRQVCYGLPVVAKILVRVNGDIDVWEIGFADDQAVYWHFAAGSEAYAFGTPPTEPQRAAIARLFFDKSLVEGLGGSVGGPVQSWCKFASAKELEALGNNGKSGFYAA